MTRDGRRLSLEYSHASGVAARIALKESFLGTIGQLPPLTNPQGNRMKLTTVALASVLALSSTLAFAQGGGGGSGGGSGGASAGSSAGTSGGTTAGSSS